MVQIGVARRCSRDMHTVVTEVNEFAAFLSPPLVKADVLNITPISVFRLVDFELSALQRKLQKLKPKSIGLFALIHRISHDFVPF